MNKKIQYTALLFILGASLFTSCTDDLYSRINQEVTLETNAISGQIYSLVRFNNKLYTSNGYLYEKTNASSTDTGLYNEQWKNLTRTDSPFGSKIVSYLASDSTYLYAYVYQLTEDDDGYNSFAGDDATKQIYYTSDGTTWNYISDETLDTLLGVTYTSENHTEGTDNIKNIKTIFCNNAVDPSNRNAYALLYSTTDDAYHVYKLNGKSAPTLVADSTNGAGSSSIAATYYNGADYFSNYKALTSNDKYIYYSKEGDTLYYANAWDSTNNCFTFNGTETGIDENESAIYSLAITNDFIIMGTDEGIAHVALSDNGLPSDGSSSFATNATSTLTSSYEVHIVFALDPTANEYKTDLYGTTDEQGSSVVWKEICLWAYYPNRISTDTGYGTWNKDGTADDANSGN